MTERTEWRVLWHLNGACERVYDDAARARDRYAVAAELGYRPILSMRTVVVGEWETVKKEADRG